MQRTWSNPTLEADKLDTTILVLQNQQTTLYQSRALDSTTMVALNELGGEQSRATEKT